MKNRNMICAVVALAGIMPVPVLAQEDRQPLTLLLTGASFAVPENGWFEIGCDDMGAVGINKAVSGQAIMNTANDMYNERFYTFEQLDATDVLVIDHVHNQNVANEEWLKDDYNDYTMPTTNYAIAYDYVIKRYKDDCYKLKDNPESRYYGTENGKPARIVLCTHWHDSRTTFNPAIRKLAAKWNLPLVEFDEKIGFTKDVPVDGKQPSLAYSQDTETINGVVYGWHPKRGRGEYIQQKMAQIFVETMAEYLNLDIPFEASLQPKDYLVMPGEVPMAKITVRHGLYPLTLNYEIDGTAKKVENVTENPYLVKLEETESPVSVSLSSVFDFGGTEADIVRENATIGIADVKEPVLYDAFVHENYKENSYVSDELLQLKTGDNWTRKIYLTFATNEVRADDECIALRIYFKETNLQNTETLSLEGNTQVYGNSLTWNNRDSKPFELLSDGLGFAPSEVGSYLSWDVTDWIKQKKEDGAENVTFRISVTSLGKSLCQFYASESEEHPEFAPSLLIERKEEGSNIENVSAGGMRVYPACFGNTLNVAVPEGELVCIYALDGMEVYCGFGGVVDASAWKQGMYIAKTGSEAVKIIKK